MLMENVVPHNQFLPHLPYLMPKYDGSLLVYKNDKYLEEWPSRNILLLGRSFQEYADLWEELLEVCKFMRGASMKSKIANKSFNLTIIIF